MRVSLSVQNPMYTVLTSDIRTTNGAAQVNFMGNVTALCQHIRHMGSKHYEVYHEYCAMNGIDVHLTAVPDDVKKKLENP